MDERFVAVFPSLVRALGSLEAAVILQHLHFNADGRGDIRLSMRQISDDTGITLRTVERRVAGLREGGYLDARRASVYDATLVYRIDHEQVSTTQVPGEIHGDTAKVADSISHPGGVPAKVADSDTAKVADSSSKNVRTPSAVVPVVTDRVRRPEPRRHTLTQLPDGWYPSSEVIEYVRWRLRSTTLRVEDSFDIFIAHFRTKEPSPHSTCWDEKFMQWVSGDLKRWHEDQETQGALDDLGQHRARDPVRHAAQVKAVRDREAYLASLSSVTEPKEKQG